LIGKCFFPIVVWQLIPSFWSIISITYWVVINEFITNLWVEEKVRNVSLYIFTPVRNVPM
jgi:hypothetical protein